MELWGDSLLLVMSHMPSYCRSRCNFLTQQQTMPTSQILGSSLPTPHLCLPSTSHKYWAFSKGRWQAHTCMYSLLTTHAYNCTCIHSLLTAGPAPILHDVSLSTVYWWHTLTCTIVTVHVCTQFTDNTYLHDVQVLVDHIQHYHEGVTHLLIEGGGEEGDHVCQSLEEGWSQVAVVSEHHQQRTECTVHKLNVRLGVVCHELRRRGTGECNISISPVV